MQHVDDWTFSFQKKSTSKTNLQIDFLFFSLSLFLWSNNDQQEEQRNNEFMLEFLERVFVDNQQRIAYHLHWR